MPYRLILFERRHLTHPFQVCLPFLTVFHFNRIQILIKPFPAPRRAATTPLAVMFNYQPVDHILHQRIPHCQRLPDFLCRHFPVTVAVHLRHQVTIKRRHQTVLIPRALFSSSAYRTKRLRYPGLFITSSPLSSSSARNPGNPLIKNL